MLSHYRRIVNAVAHAVSAATKGHMRVSMTMGPTATAALDPDCLGADAEFDAPPEELAGADVCPAGPEGLTGAPADGLPVPEGAAPEAEGDPAEVPPVDALAMDPPDALELPLEVELKVGGGTAVEGSTSAPFPIPTVCPSDVFSVCVAGVEEPSVPAIVKRVVQVMSSVAPETNW